MANYRLENIGIISDTHGDPRSWEQAMTVWQEVDLILHAGDVLYHGPRNPLVASYNPPRLAELLNTSRVPLLIARGNCDAEVDQLLLDYPLRVPMVLVQTPWWRIMVVHGDQIEGPETAADMIRRYRLDLLVSGHTHLPHLQEVGGGLWLNPGSASLPKEGPPTVARLRGDLVELLELPDGRVRQSYRRDQDKCCSSR